MTVQLPNAPDWGLAVGEIGRWLVIAALACFVLTAVGSLLRWKRNPVFFRLGTAFVVLTMIAHVSLLLGEQYQFRYVFNNTSETTPTVYRLSAAWAAQEGSFLLWTLTSAVIASFAVRRTGKYMRWFLFVTSIALIGMVGISWYESPFQFLPQALHEGNIYLPVTGTGLNPTLENYWMAIHPWVIFIGFGSLLTLFAWAWAAALSKDWVTWVAQIRPWAIFSMMICGVGLVMGGLWAYETLGWGGFWAWDPVENVSLVPFLASAALIHGLHVGVNRGGWPRLNLLLAALPFFWFIYGTYLTRSGALVDVSVHSFAEMNAGAHKVLMLLVILTVSSVLCLAVYVWRKKMDLGKRKDVGSREIGMAFGLALTYVVAILAALGMSKPFFGLLLGMEKEALTEDVYNTFMPIPFIPVMVFLAITPLLGWGTTSDKRKQAISFIFAISVLLFGAFSYLLVSAGLTTGDGEQQGERLVSQLFSRPELSLFLVLMFVCIFAIVGNAYRLYERIRSRTGGFGSFVTHAGVALLLCGLIVSKSFEKTGNAVVTESRSREVVLGRTVFIASLDELPTPEQAMQRENKMQVTLQAMDGSDRKILARPTYFESERFYEWQQASSVTRPYIHRSWSHDIYMATGVPSIEFRNEIKVDPGGSTTLQDTEIDVRYVAQTMDGEPGQPGTEFGAQIVVSYEDKDFEANPRIRLMEGGGVTRIPAAVGADFVLMLVSLDAATGRATLQMDFAEPFLYFEVYFKPMTILVWIGAGMILLGGTLSIRKAAIRAGVHPDEVS